MKGQINFYQFKDFGITLNPNLTDWLTDVMLLHGFSFSEINYSIYSDEDMLKMNTTYLQHNFYTDIITFDNTLDKTISADIALSYDRIKENAMNNCIEFSKELHRVMVHGILHCIGFSDHTEEEKRFMRKEEDNALLMFHVEQSKENKNV